MKKLTLSEWASVAEIVGAILVVISLLFVAFSLERNTAALSGENDDALFDSIREIGLVVLGDPELVKLTKRGQNDPTSLTALERARYLEWVSVHLDIWTRTIRREQKGLLTAEEASDWHEYYEEFAKRSLTPEMWQELKWNWGNFSIVARIDALMAN